jgi:cytochrome b561
VAGMTHWIFYALIIAVPFVGWVVISTFPYPSSFFGLFAIPNLLLLPYLTDQKKFAVC